MAKKVIRKAASVRVHRHRRRAPSRQQTLNKRAINELQSVSEKYRGTDLAKQATALQRALASSRPSKAATQRRLQSFAVAAAKKSPSRKAKVMKKTVRGGGGGKQRPTAGITKTLGRNTKASYQTAVFKCWGDYQTCCQHAHWGTCAAWAALCIANQLKALGLGPAAIIVIKTMVGH